jgi:Tfp pilus tip-associated adhesin PilY1
VGLHARAPCQAEAPVENGIFGTGLISYPPTPALGSTPKDYFFDGSAGLFQNADDSRIWVFPSMRRGGRMLYAFDVTIPTAPLMKWRVGCTNSALSDTASCINSAGVASSEFAQMGQTWSTPTVARIKGFSTDPNRPVVIVGGGYDTCEDQDAKPNTACTGAGYTRRGNRVFAIDADTGSRLASFATDGSVPADITVVDRDFDGMVDHAYAADTTGGIYRIDFVDPGTLASRAPGAWTVPDRPEPRGTEVPVFAGSAGGGRQGLSLGRVGRPRAASHHQLSVPHRS